MAGDIRIGLGLRFNERSDRAAKRFKNITNPLMGCETLALEFFDPFFE